MPKNEQEKSTPKNGGEKTLDEKNLDELSEEELRKAAKSYKGRFEHEREKKQEFKETVESLSSDEEEEEEEESEESEEVTSDESKETGTEQDPYEFAKELSALQDLDEKQIDAVKTIAKAKGISPSEARETDEAQKLIEKYEEEKKKEKQTPEPSNKQGTPEEEPMSPDELKEAVQKGDKDAMNKFLEDSGMSEHSEAFRDQE